IPPDLQRTEKAVKRAETEKTSAASRRDAAHGVMIQARSSVEGARARVAEYEAQSIRANRQVEENTTALTAALAPLECPAGILLEHFVEQEFAAFERLSKESRDLADKIARVDLSHQRAESDLAGARQNLTGCEETVDRLRNEVAEAERQIVEYEKTMAVVGSADPTKEIETLQAEINTLEQRLQHLKALNHEAQTKAQTTERKCAELNIRLASLAGEREQAESAATNALSGAGFSDGMEARAAILPQSAITAGEARLAKFEGDVKQLSVRVTELDALLDGVTISKVDVEAAVRTVEDKEVESKGFEQRFGELSGQIKKLRSDTEKAELLRVEQCNRVARNGIVQQLARDLKSDGFQQYLLEGSFRRLVSGASSRLRQLDDRYELIFVDSKFAVIDHDHGSQTRLADTLSGGETFLVSLALALELSEQVQQAAGAVRLDSLFIDEGFGTLDPETLDTVAEAIESLGQTNRMVGVITHVAELHRRLPRLEISSNPSGSTVRFVED
ncbi:MAG: hypothetical protein M3Y27_25750, partial [Acidobacteriota bacterium]|nr:hypothetical protein [Acidobacteriota bacterium]